MPLLNRDTVAGLTLDADSHLHRTVACPRCGAGRGAHCTTAAGDTSHNAHAGRVRASIGHALDIAALRLRRGQLARCRSALTRVSSVSHLTPEELMRVNGGWDRLGRAERDAEFNTNE